MAPLNQASTPAGIDTSYYGRTRVHTNVDLGIDAMKTTVRCDAGRLTVANGRAWECRGGHWVAVVGQADQNAIAHAGAPAWVDGMLMLMLVFAGVAAVAMVRLARLDWIEARKRRQANESSN